MKKRYFLFTLLGSLLSFSQGSINFDDATKWSATTPASYGNHTYTDGSFTATGVDVLRNTTTAQDVFAGALGTYSFRLRDNSTTNLTMTIASGGVGNFTFKARRWDATPATNFTVEYSTDGGTTWTSFTPANYSGTASTTVFNTTATTVNAFGAATTLNLGAATGTTTVGNSLVVTGDLFVNGTTTQVNTTELFVEDKFIVLASGSATAADAGIMIDRGSDTDGNIAFGFDVATDRWGYQNGLSDVSGSMVIGTNGNSAFAGYVFTEAAHTSTKPTTGEFVQAGSIYANTDGTLWMYA